MQYLAYLEREIYEDKLMKKEKEVVLILVKELMRKLPRFKKEDLIKMSYNGGKDLCPEWAINHVLSERGEKVEITEKIEEQTEAQLKNEVIMLLIAKNYREASEKLARFIIKNNYIYTTRDDLNPEIWIYYNGIYVPQGKTFIKETCRRILESGYTSFICNEVINKIEADTFIEHDKFFSNNYKTEIPVNNGILNIMTGELSEFNPKKIFFSKCPVRYEPLAECQMIDTFLSDVLSNPEDKKVYYEIGGSCLLKEYLFEKAFMFLGTGRNGKGKSLELINRVIGAENCYSLSLAALQHDNADVSQLFGKMVNLAGDIGHKDLQETSMFKSLTGRDLITARRKFLTALIFENYAKFIFACNDLPMVYDTSKGFWDRWILLEFPFYFGTQDEIDKASEEEIKTIKLRDETIIDKITTEKELSGLLNQFLLGLHRILENKGYSSTKGSEETKNTWIRKSNSFMAFCMDLLQEDYEGKITKKELRKKYSQYLKKHKTRGKSEVVIKRTLEELYGASDEKIESFGVTERYWSGIKWK
jgi:putative DNA primase/helicase